MSQSDPGGDRDLTHNQGDSGAKMNQSTGGRGEAELRRREERERAHAVSRDMLARLQRMKRGVTEFGCEVLDVKVGGQETEDPTRPHRGTTSPVDTGEVPTGEAPPPGPNQSMLDFEQSMGGAGGIEERHRLRREEEEREMARSKRTLESFKANLAIPI